MFYRAMLRKENAKKNGKKAFTLIELIVVIAIIGVLIAILVPTMMGFVTQAEEQTRSANARSVYSAATAAYANAVASGVAAELQADALLAEVGDLLGTQFTSNGASFTVAWLPDGATGTTAVTGIKSVTFTNAGGSATYPTTP